MVPCWLCSKTFPNKTALNTHLTSKEHRRQTVICVWCPRENTFTKPGDLASHCRQYHFKETKNLSKTFFSISNCFYFAVFPNDYVAIASKIESWTSPDAIEARGLVQKCLEKQPGASVKLELWQQGWKVATRVKVRTKGGPSVKGVEESDHRSVDPENKSEESGVEPEEASNLKSVKVIKEVIDATGKQSGDKVAKDDSKVSEKGLELEASVEADRETVVTDDEVRNERKIVDTDTDNSIQKIDIAVEVERVSEGNRDGLVLSKLKQCDTETEKKQEVEKQTEEKVESERNDLVTKVKHREISKDSKSGDIVVHKPKKHKHKSKRSHEDSDRKMKKAKTKRMKTDMDRNETKENHEPEAKNIDAQSGRNPLMTLKDSNVNLEKQEDRKQEIYHVNKTPIRCIDEFESYVKDLAYGQSNQLSSGEETPLQDEKTNPIVGELELVRDILDKDISAESRKRDNTDETKSPKRVKIRYEDYVAKKRDKKVVTSGGSDRKLDGEERIINEKGESVSMLQGEDEVWRRVSKLVESDKESATEKVRPDSENIENPSKTKKEEESGNVNNKERNPEDKVETATKNSNTEDIHVAETESSNEVETTGVEENESSNDQTDYAIRSINILRRGVMPFCPPARRQWGLDTEEEIPVGRINMIWPPKSWNLMTPDRRLLTAETMAMTMEAYFYGRVDAEMSRGYLLDKYNYLILPGSSKHHQEKAEIAATKSRYYTYQLLREIANGKKPSFAEQQQLGMLELVMQNQVLPHDPRSMSVPLRLNQEELPFVSK